MPIGREQDGLIFRKLPDNRFRVRRRNDHVRERLHLGRTVDVRDGDVIGVAIAKMPEDFGTAGVFQRTPGLSVRNQHRAGRSQDLRHFAHEAHSAKDDDVGLA